MKIFGSKWYSIACLFFGMGCLTIAVMPSTPLWLRVLEVVIGTVDLALAGVSVYIGCQLGEEQYED